jgi:hypothetical protein
LQSEIQNFVQFVLLTKKNCIEISMVSYSQVTTQKYHFIGNRNDSFFRLFGDYKSQLRNNIFLELPRVHPLEMVDRRIRKVRGGLVHAVGQRRKQVEAENRKVKKF